MHNENTSGEIAPYSKPTTVEILKEPPLITYHKGITLRNYLLERSSEGQIKTKCLSRVLPVANF